MNHNQAAAEVIGAIIGLLESAEHNSQIEHCVTEFLDRFVPKFCPTQDRDIIAMVDRYNDALQAAKDRIYLKSHF